MELGMIGLGRMGGNMAQRLLQGATRSSHSTPIRRRCRHRPKRAPPPRLPSLTSPPF